MTTNREAAEQAASILDGQDCPHETPGGAPMCALCREAVLRQHEGYERIKGRRHGLPVPRTHVPMPDYVRRAWAAAMAPVPVQPSLLGDEAGDDQ